MKSSDDGVEVGGDGCDGDAKQVGSDRWVLSSLKKKKMMMMIEKYFFINGERKPQKKKITKWKIRFRVLFINNTPYYFSIYLKIYMDILFNNNNNFLLMSAPNEISSHI